MSSRFAIVLSSLILIEVYSYQAFRTVFRKKPVVRYTYIGLHVLLYAAILGGFFIWRAMPRSVGEMLFTIIISLIIPKLIMALIMFGEDIVRGFRWIWQKARPKTSVSHSPNKITRSEFLSKTTMAIAAVPFIAVIDGVTRQKYNYKVRRIQIPVKDLPESFQGLTFTQISDIHTGSFDSKTSVKAGIELINEQESDFIFFTGDLVNNYVDETKGWTDLYRQLYAPEGVYSTLGNHDYGDYNPWNSQQDKQDHFKRMIETHHSIGWNLLKNQHHLFHRGEDTLAVIGVENWGARGFTKYGKLSEAASGTEGADVKILLSHDPSHWDAQVRTEQPDIDLTLSGHTHGAQFGVEIPGLKFSPVQFMYKQWAGLYQENNQYLYVNRGFGFLGFKGRVGIRPEIAVFELVKA